MQYESFLLLSLSSLSFFQPAQGQTMGFLWGEYTGVSGRLVTFYPDGTYTLKSTGGDLVVENATYAIEGSILKLVMARTTSAWALRAEMSGVPTRMGSST